MNTLLFTTWAPTLSPLMVSVPASSSYIGKRKSVFCVTIFQMKDIQKNTERQKK